MPHLALLKLTSLDRCRRLQGECQQRTTFTIFSMAQWYQPQPSNSITQIYLLLAYPHPLKGLLEWTVRISVKVVDSFVLTSKNGLRNLRVRAIG